MKMGAFWGHFVHRRITLLQPSFVVVLLATLRFLPTNTVFIPFLEHQRIIITSWLKNQKTYLLLSLLTNEYFFV